MAQYGSKAPYFHSSGLYLPTPWRNNPSFGAIHRFLARYAPFWRVSTDFDAIPSKKGYARDGLRPKRAYPGRSFVQEGHRPKRTYSEMDFVQEGHRGTGARETAFDRGLAHRLDPLTSPLSPLPTAHCPLPTAHSPFKKSTKNRAIKIDIAP
jgi:hypothetical protein